MQWGPFFEKSVREEIKKAAFEADQRLYVVARPGDHNAIGPWLQHLLQNIMVHLEEKVTFLTAEL